MKEQDLDVKRFYTRLYPKIKLSSKPKAVRMQEILARLRKETVVLFTPWGPRYDLKKRGVTIRGADREIETLRFLAHTAWKLSRVMPSKRIRWLFLGADIYGTRINNLPVEETAAYFSNLKNWVAELMPAAEFRLWSEFDSEAETYRHRAAERMNELVSRDIQNRAAETAVRMGRGGDSRAYIVERLAEAEFIEERFSPIKISCAPRHKDTGVDRELPRLYLLPRELQTPWL